MTMRKWLYIIVLLVPPAVVLPQVGIQYFPKKVGVLTKTVPSALTVSGGVLADTLRTPHFCLPHVDGTNGQVMATNGSGAVSWISLSGATLPSLTSAYFWVGNGSNEATAVALSGDGTLSNTGALAVSDDSHAHTTTTVSGLDISSDTNLSATSGIVLTGDALSHSTADGYKHVPSTGSSTQLLQYSAAGTAKWITVSGDATIADGGAVTLSANAADSTNLADGSVTSETIKDAQVKTADLAANAVDSTKIKDGAVTSESIQDGQVKLADLQAQTSANWASKVIDETGSGSMVFGTSPTITGATLGVVNGSAITGQAKHLRFTVMSPNAVFTADSCICIWPKVDAGITIDSVTVTTSSASYNIAGDLRFANSFIGRVGGSTGLIKALDTSSGVLYSGTFDDATVDAGKCMYLKLDSAPSSSMSQFSVDIKYRY